MQEQQVGIERSQWSCPHVLLNGADIDLLGDGREDALGITGASSAGDAGKSEVPGAGLLL